MKSAWGSDDPTRAGFAFAHSLALAEAGHEVQIFLLGEATYLMRKATADAATPIGWPPIGDLRDKIVAKHINVFACGACSALAASPKRTSLPGTRSLAIRRFSLGWWSGRIESLRSERRVNSRSLKVESGRGARRLPCPYARDNGWRKGGHSLCSPFGVFWGRLAGDAE